MKLFMDQSEVSAIPAECLTNGVTNGTFPVMWFQ